VTDAATGPVGGRAVRARKAAAFAGIAFSVILSFEYIAVRTVVPADPEDAGRWLSDDERRGAVLAAFGAMPCAAILVLWFVGVLRTRLGKSEDQSSLRDELRRQSPAEWDELSLAKPRGGRP